MISEIAASLRTSGDPGSHVFRFAGEWGVRFPANDGAGFHVVVRGGGWLITAGRAPVPLRTGDVVFSPTGAEHGIGHGPMPLERLPARSLERPDPVAVETEFVCGGYQHVRERPHPVLRTMPDPVVMTPDFEHQPGLRPLIGLIREEIRNPDPAVPALLDLLLAHTLRWWRDRGDWPAVADPAVAAVLQAVHADLGGPWTVRRMSDLAGMEPARFTRCFRAELDQSPMAYVIGQRLARGARLLRSTRKPLAAIAQQTGYSSEFAFSAAFSKQYAMAPGRYRKSHA